MKIEGKWFDGKTSKSTAAILYITKDGRCFVQCIIDGAPQQTKEYFEPDISARLANTPRYISFSENELFETENNTSVDLSLKRLKKKHWSTGVHILESRHRHVLVALVLLALFALVTVKFIVPAGSKAIAHHLPPSLLNTTSKQTLSFLDKALLAKSELEEKRQKQLNIVFQPVLDDHPDIPLRILFRKGDSMGANAFALPDGTIVFTDELIKLSENNEELIAILTHEIGHIAHRHSMRRLIQNSILSFAILSITGDSSGISEIFLGLPLVLTELGYSRKFELEADVYSINSLKSLNIHPQHFANILSRLDSHLTKESGKTESSSLESYLSTHPATHERIKNIQQSFE